MSKVCGLEDALSCIKDGDMVASTGVIGWLTPDALFKGIADRYRMGKGAGNAAIELLAMYMNDREGTSYDIN